jgi:hypothetical protein
MNSSTTSQTGERHEPRRQSRWMVSSKNGMDRAPDGRQSAAHRVLFLDDDPARAESFLSANPHAIWVQTVEECLGRLVESWDEVHLDHDLGGRVFVDMNKTDCGMEVIRWLCKERRDHLSSTHFFVHTHNSLAGLLMVLQMQSSGYRAEFRPFGVDPALFLPGGANGPTIDGVAIADVDSSPLAASVRPRRGALHRWRGLLRGCWNFLKQEHRFPARLDNGRSDVGGPRD